MTFLSPLYLWLLPLILIPVIIHLLAKQKSTLIEFPSLKFLKLLEQDALRKFNIKQLILLILRTLMVFIIILIFARPSLNIHNEFGLYTQTADLLVFVLDNTASNRSNFQNISGEWLDEFRLDLEEKGIQVYFCSLTDLELKNSPEQISPEYAKAASGDYSHLIAEQIDLERFKRKSIVWLGDGQDLESQLNYLSDWDKYLLWSPVVNDMGISLVELPKVGVRKGAIYELGIGVERAENDQETIGIELIINDKRENQTVVEPEVSFVEVSTKVSDPGFQNGQLELGQDEHAYNNMRYFVLPASGDIPVQVLRSKFSTDFWSIFEAAVEGMNLNLDIRTLDYSELDNLNLSEGGTVIIDDADKLEAYNWNRLKTFVAKSGQLILFGNGGAHMQDLLQFDVIPSEEVNRTPFGLYFTEAGKQKLQSNPLETAVSQDRLKVFQRYNTSAGELDDTWIRYLDDQPFLGASSWGDGRIIWFNSKFGTGYNNLTYLGVFPTLILQLCQSQKSENLSNRFNAEIGDTLHFLPNSQIGENTPFSIQGPEGIVEFQAPDSNYIIHYPNTLIPGIYNLMQGRHILQPVAVNIATHEAQAHSKTYKYDKTELFVSEKRVALVHEILERRSGQALWPILLSLLLLLWIVETYLSRIKKTWRQDD